MLSKQTTPKATNSTLPAVLPQEGGRVAQTASPAQRATHLLLGLFLVPLRARMATLLQHQEKESLLTGI